MEGYAGGVCCGIDCGREGLSTRHRVVGRCGFETGWGGEGEGGGLL